MSNNTCPCKGCVPPKRKPGCHGACPEYKGWHNKHLWHKRTIDAMKLCDSICDNYAIGEMEKNAKIRRELEKYR